MRLRRRTIFWLVAGVAILALFAAAFRPRPVEVDTATIGRGVLRTSVEGEARTRVRNLYVVAAPVSGSLQRISLAAGDRTRRGDTLARIAAAPLDPQAQAMAEARLQAAESIRREVVVRVEQARNAVTQAQRALNRLKPLLDAGGVSQQQVDDAEDALRIAHNEANAVDQRLAAADADVRAAQAALIAVREVTGGAALVAVLSPAAGRVLRVPLQSQRIIAAGTPIMEVGDPADLEIVVDVLSTDAIRMRPGNPVELTGWGGDTTLLAEVQLIEPAATTQLSALGVEEQRVNVLARFTGSSGGLGDGFRADARIIIWQGENVLMVPMSALFRGAAGWNAYIVRDGRAQLVEVQAGHTSESDAEVISGLAEGDEVILFPSDRVQDGVKIRAR
jgi:HlyD family secretion protein